MSGKEELSKIYSNRFAEKEWKKRNSMWRVLCRAFFDKYVSSQDDVLDIAAGYCDFINNIAKSEKIGRRIAVDLNPDVKKHAADHVETYNAMAQDLSFLKDESVDIVFISNFLEHIKEKDDILKIFQECRRVLRKGGRIMILQPNIKLVNGAYWDFFDHYTPLTEKSLEEALNITGGFKTEDVIVRFLPYTTKSRIPQMEWMIYLYCKIPLIWKIMGKQTFLTAIKQ